MIDINNWLLEIIKHEAQVIDPIDLPKRAYNTLQAKMLIGKGKRTVCGTVVSTKLSSKGNTFINLDRSFPNQIFTASIFKSNQLNFSYDPHITLKNKQVCVNGKITDYRGTPSMVIENEEAIEILELDIEEE